MNYIGKFNKQIRKHIRLTRYIRSFASLAAGATQGLQTPHIAIRYALFE